MARKLISSDSPYENIIGFSRAVRVGNFISVGGTAPLGPNGETVGRGNVSVQTRQCIEIIKTALEKAGASLSDVIRTRILLKNIEDWKSVAKVKAEYFKDIRPADTIMQITTFVDPDWLIEMEVDAIVDE